MAIVGANQPIGLVPLTGGVSSDVFRADLPTGSVCVKRALPKLKVAADWRAPVERNHWEVEWMRIAAAIVPAAVPEILGEDRESRMLRDGISATGSLPGVEGVAAGRRRRPGDGGRGGRRAGAHPRRDRRPTRYRGPLPDRRDLLRDPARALPRAPPHARIPISRRGSTRSPKRRAKRSACSSTAISARRTC